jgi:hypothetical protein
MGQFVNKTALASLLVTGVDSCLKDKASADYRTSHEVAQPLIIEFINSLENKLKGTFDGK